MADWDWGKISGVIASLLLVAVIWIGMKGPAGQVRLEEQIASLSSRVERLQDERNIKPPAQVRLEEQIASLKAEVGRLRARAGVHRALDHHPPAGARLAQHERQMANHNERLGYLERRSPYRRQPSQ